MSMYIDFFSHTYQFFFAKKMHMNMYVHFLSILYVERENLLISFL